MKAYGRILVGTAGILMLIACVTGCGKKGQATAVEMPKSTMIAEIPQKTKPAVTQNLLTGLEDLSEKAVGKRPVAVMVNNVEDALPQYGIDGADVIFELPVEGSLTRLMALYADYTKVPKICAIRSCRYYYPAIAQGFDAFYVHWGSDQTIVSYVNSLGIDRFDGIGNPYGMFGRDTSRRSAGYALEHTGYFDGTMFAKTVDKAGMRTDLRKEKKGTAFSFADLGEAVTPSGETCKKVHIRFGAATGTLTYDKDSGLYKKKINGHDHIDGKSREVLKFTNVIVLETSISIRDAKGHKQLDWAGSKHAKGYYISNGRMEQITWSKAGGNEKSYLKFYKKSGEELILNRGKSYIAYTTPGTIDFS